MMRDERRHHQRRRRRRSKRFPAGRRSEDEMPAGETINCYISVKELADLRSDRFSAAIIKRTIDIDDEDYPDYLRCLLVLCEDPRS